MKYFVAMYYNKEMIPLAQSLIAANTLEEAKSYIGSVDGAHSCGVVELHPSLIEEAGVAMFEFFIDEEELDIPTATGGFLN